MKKRGRQPLLSRLKLVSSLRIEMLTQSHRAAEFFRNTSSASPRLCVRICFGSVPSRWSDQNAQVHTLTGTVYEANKNKTQRTQSYSTHLSSVTSVPLCFKPT